jgi:hypothetical protein
MDRSAARFLLLDARSAYLCPDVFPSHDIAASRLLTMMEQKEAHITALLQAQAAKYRTRVVSHWSDLAPNSAASRTAVSLEHLQNVLQYLRKARRHVTTALEANSKKRGQTMRTLSVLVGSAESVTVPTVIATVAADEELLAALQKCVASELRLARLERYKTFAAGGIAGSFGSNNDTSSDSLRFMKGLLDGDDSRIPGSSTAQFESIGSSAQDVFLRQLVLSLRDSLHPVGKRIADMRRAVGRWVDKGYEGATVARRIGALVESIVADAKDEYWSVYAGTKGDREENAADDSEDGSGDASRPEEGQLPDDIATALVEDEVFSTRVVAQLQRLLTDPAQPVVTAECRRSASLSMETLHVPATYRTEHHSLAYLNTIAVLATMPLFLTPSRKLDVLRSASKQLLLEMKRLAIAKGKVDLTVGGDDFIPTFMFCIMSANLPTLTFEANYLQHCMAPSCRHSELGYYATTLEFTTEFIKNMAQQHSGSQAPHFPLSSPRPSVLSSSASLQDVRSSPGPSPLPGDARTVQRHVLCLDAVGARRWEAAAPKGSVVVVQRSVALEGYRAVARPAWALESHRPVRIAAQLQPLDPPKDGGALWVCSAVLLLVRVSETQLAALESAYGGVTSLADGTEALLAALPCEDETVVVLAAAASDPPAWVRLLQCGLDDTAKGPLGGYLSSEGDLVKGSAVLPYQPAWLDEALPYLSRPQTAALHAVLQLQTHLLLCGLLNPSTPGLFASGCGDAATLRAMETATAMFRASSPAECIAKLHHAVQRAVAVVTAKRPLWPTVSPVSPGRMPLSEVQDALAHWQAAAAGPKAGSHKRGVVDPLHADFV